MIQSDVGQPKGILNLKTGQKKFQLSQHKPPPDLECFIAHYWIVRWNLEAPYVSETLPHPSVHLAIEEGHTEIVGVVTGKFSRLIEGSGRVFGIKFRPGAFYPFVKTPVSTFTNKSIPLPDVFGAAGTALEAAILAVDDSQDNIDSANAFLRQCLPEQPEQDENLALIHRITEFIVGNREITRVEDVVSHFALTKRTLQRLFNQYVGVSPKWMIKRYRLHEAADQLNNGGSLNSINWLKLALDLGYFDQAHFIKDFKHIVGWTPGEYARIIDQRVSS